MRDVEFGTFLRYTHSNGASMFFIVVYLHILKGLYYGSFAYPRQLLWLVGCIILVLMIATAFFGYVLPWGQMSFWAATVITNLFGALPIVGAHIVFWLWGGFAVDNATLNRFFSFHFLLPFIIAFLSGLHLALLHQWGSNNPVGVTIKTDTFGFVYYILKDFYGVLVFAIFSCVFIFFFPNYLGHSDNYILANPLVTPAHIVPEWYFLPYYAILRSITDKLFGVCAMAMAIASLFILPFYVKINFVRVSNYKPLFQVFFFLFVAVCVFLGWIAKQPVQTPYFEVSQFLTFSFFFMIFLAGFERFEFSLISIRNIGFTGYFGMWFIFFKSYTFIRRRFIHKL